MKRTSLSAFVIALALSFSSYAQAQAIERVISLNFDSSASAAEALEELFQDSDMRGNKATLYAADFGVMSGASHVIVADHDNYAARATADKRRRESHGWAKYLLATQDAEFVSADLAIVVEDFGKPRHEAGYVIVFLMQVKDVNAYRAALKDLNTAQRNPGVLRLVELRSGSTAVTHAVLVGADDFAAANEYIDELFASDAFATFKANVSDIRSVVAIEMYRRVGAYGY
ncbi:MAG: hypothetical protein OER97_08150 [Gammaproteobacteria bacterium]|nr:hypothetical protein [Gammaproteobacteria bacterium]